MRRMLQSKGSQFTNVVFVCDTIIIVRAVKVEQNALMTFVQTINWELVANLIKNFHGVQMSYEKLMMAFEDIEQGNELMNYRL